MRRKMIMIKLALVRTASLRVSNDNYNIQEIGLAKQLCKAGFAVDVYLISSTGEEYREKIEAETELNVFWMKNTFSFGGQAYFPSLMGHIKAHEYDLIQILDYLSLQGIAISAYCRQKKLPFVLWEGLYEDFDKPYKKAIQWVYEKTLLRILRKNTRHTLYKTNAARAFLTDKGFPEGPVIPIGLETVNFDNETPRDFLQEYSIPEGAQVLLYIGQMVKRKMPLFTLEVFEALSQTNENVWMFFVGKGALLEQAKAYAQSHALNRVIFIESVPQKEIPSLYRQSSAFLLPSINEIFGMVVLESMYFGTPVIAYNTAGARDIIVNGVDGLVMDSYDIGAWRDAIETSIFNNADYEHMCEKARKKVTGDYLWDKVANKYADMYKAIKKAREGTEC